MCSDKKEIVLGLGYFDIDAELVYQTVRNNLNPLLEAVRFFIAKMGNEQ